MKTRKRAVKLCRQLRTMRLRLGLTQMEVAARADISQNAISALELGQNVPALDTYFAVLEVLQRAARAAKRHAA